MKSLLKTLFSLPRQRKQIIQLLADSLLIVLSLFMAMLLRLDSVSFLSDPGVWTVLPVMVPVSLYIFIRLGFYRAIIRYMGLKAVQAVLGGVLGSALTLALISFLFDLPIPRSVPFIYAMLALITIGGARLALRLLYQHGQQRLKTRVLIYGAGAAGRQLVMSVRHGRDYEPIAFVDFAPKLQGTVVQGLKVYSPDDTERLIESYGVEKLLLAIPDATRARRMEILEAIEPLTIPVQTIPDMADVISGKARVNELRDVAVEDLLGRDPIPPNPELMGANISGKIVMVTGAGGSIGSELCRQILRQHPRQLLLLDISEFGLYRIEQDLQRIAKAESLGVPVKPILCSVQNRDRMRIILSTFKVQTLFHAAAYKHVPMVELNMAEGLRNNIFGTQAVAEAAIACQVSDFVLVSTDKAVRPTNIMGASKRMAELVCQAKASQQSTTRFSMVRFGNVLGSSGSVVPLFRRQIEMGGPLTVTHPEITRYFMTIPEAAQLVIQAGAMARGGDVFVLDMGKPVKIAELAARMIRLTGLEPSFPGSVRQEAKAVKTKPASDDESWEPPSRKGDIEIVFTGLRPGEKLYEELLIGQDVGETRHPRIMTASEEALSWDELKPILDALDRACEERNYPEVREIFLKAAIGYRPESDIVDHQWMVMEHQAKAVSNAEDEKVVEQQPAALSVAFTPSRM
ncbi:MULTISPECIES: nucleoside-diphosphate sugar epimerase/dehydratase [Halomonadaceae]|uniref:polysaccharide biosynthesis protein n=1 Tax=Halomonadaceae TaxID=28256 RepID=UPI00159791EA|nr:MULTISPECIES: nucleoside-diphosphate sugar epimerase/dehydratase [Halomonas]QJQ93997.1 polysaccharide biosynthesis protein [Halomonas sp. PA5]